jgi:hypothetical protein
MACLLSRGIDMSWVLLLQDPMMDFLYGLDNSDNGANYAKHQ